VINYYLARYPDMQEKLQKELDEALARQVMLSLRLNR
jgi:hypothetical protein